MSIPQNLKEQLESMTEALSKLAPNLPIQCFEVSIEERMVFSKIPLGMCLGKQLDNSHSNHMFVQSSDKQSGNQLYLDMPLDMSFDTAPDKFVDIQFDNCLYPGMHIGMLLHRCVLLDKRFDRYPHPHKLLLPDKSTGMCFDNFQFSHMSGQYFDKQFDSQQNLDILFGKLFDKPIGKPSRNGVQPDTKIGKCL